MALTTARPHPPPVCDIPATYYVFVVMRTEADRLDELMSRYGGGEDGVFDELYRLLSPRLYRFCLRLAMREPEPAPPAP